MKEAKKTAPAETEAEEVRCLLNADFERQGNEDEVWFDYINASNAG